MKAGPEELESELLSGFAQAFLGRNRFAQAIGYSKEAMERPLDQRAAERSYFSLAFCCSVNRDKQGEQYYTEELRRLAPNGSYLTELL